MRDDAPFLRLKLGQLEALRVVAESVLQGIPVGVRVVDAGGAPE
jgi:hypothetical protein